MLGIGKINQKTVLTFLMGVFMLVAGWRLAFERTIEAVSLNRRLKERSIGGALVSDNPDYLKKKSELLSIVINRYSADSAEWKNGFWLAVSRMAIRKNVHIQFSPEPPNLEADSAGKGLMKQKIAFEGSYKSLVSLLDTLERSDKVGYMSSLTFQSSKEEGKGAELRKLYMEVEFGVLKKD